MAEEFLSRAEFGQFVARMDKRFGHVQEGIAELRSEIREMRSELRSQRVLMMTLLALLVVSLALVVVGGLVKLAFFM